MATTDSEKDEEQKARDAEELADDAEESGADEEGSDHEESGADEGSDDESSDDESSDDESSDDESSDDESSDDEGSDDETAEASSATSRSTAGRGGKDKARRRAKDGMTAGARLAAAKAAKAARKAAKKGKEKKAQDPVAQVRESALVQRAEQAGSWAKDNRGTVLVALAVLVIGLGGWMGWRYHTDQEAQAAASLLEDAVEIADAAVIPEEEDGDDAAHADAERPDTDHADDEDEAPTFPTEQARAEAALEAYRRVLSQYPDSTAAPWARLGEARALFELDHNDEARTAYEQAITEGGADSAVVWRALEGKGFTFEAEEHWDQALGVYQELARVDDARFEPVASYHMARMYLAKNDRERATETLRGVVDHLREAEDDEHAQDFQYVLAQAQTRLRELDPSAVPAPPPGLGDQPFGGGGGGADQLTPEQLQELIRRFQQQQQAGGGAGGGGAE